MSLPDQPAAYNDCYSLFEQASAQPNGVRAPFRTENEAKFFQLRMHQARAIQRKLSRRIYPPDSPQYDTSEFDELQIQVRGDTAGEFWVYVRRHGVKLTYVEPIEEDNTNA